MQVFLPHPNFAHSVACLDRARLGKQRVECGQILSSLRLQAKRDEPFTGGVTAAVAEEGSVGWANHPAVKMWRGYESALGLYMTLCIAEWEARGYANTMVTPYDCELRPNPIYHYGHAMVPLSDIVMPAWLGDQRVHASHRARLLHKDADWYAQFGWTEQPADDKTGYFWPTKEIA